MYYNDQPHARASPLAADRRDRSQPAYRSHLDDTKIRGCLGEAFVDKRLRQSGYFNYVAFPSRCQLPTRDYVTDWEGEVYYIKETGDHFDIIARDINDLWHFFEVKTHDTLAPADIATHNKISRGRVGGMTPMERALLNNAVESGFIAHKVMVYPKGIRSGAQPCGTDTRWDKYNQCNIPLDLFAPTRAESVRFAEADEFVGQVAT
jgi:hypothetical protein